MRIDAVYTEKSIFPLLGEYKDKRVKKEARDEIDLGDTKGIVLRRYPHFGVFTLRLESIDRISIENEFVNDNWGRIRAYNGFLQELRRAESYPLLNWPPELVFVDMRARREVRFSIAPNKRD